MEAVIAGHFNQKKGEDYGLCGITTWILVSYQ